ncbi:hypothetical protein TrCOL_g9355 [Triparma columacea]|uniref:UDP-galactose transporter n=1 Tax=Triparma columacea TaxID=722753 RepID=A0A9W7LCF2_9STRA|nr:hypothetical protein TrCOL_g9355 [Triparma columacea]
MGDLPISVSKIEKKSVFTPFQVTLLSLMVIQNSSVVLLGRYSQAGVDPSEKFSVKSLVTLTEGLKLVSCLVLVGLDNLKERYPSHGDAFLPSLDPVKIMSKLPAATWAEISKIIEAPKNSLVVSPPAALYLFQNNILYVALANLSAPVFQVCYQSKLVTTALVSVLMLNRKYTKIQWICFVFLGFGVAIVVLGEQSDTAEDKDLNIPVGLFAVAMASLSSAFAGVWFEKVVKGTGKLGAGTAKPTSLWVRNIELAFFSIAFSVVYNFFEGLLYPNEGKGTDGTNKPFLHGFTPVTYLLVILQAGGGLLVAAIVKYADNVVKGLATGVAVVVSTTFSCLFLGTAVTVNFLMGGFMILVSVWSFSNHEKVAKWF